MRVYTSNQFGQPVASGERDGGLVAEGRALKHKYTRCTEDLRERDRRKEIVRKKGKRSKSKKRKERMKIELELKSESESKRKGDCRY